MNPYLAQNHAFPSGLQGFTHGPVPLMTAIDPAKEPRYQQFVKSHPDLFTQPMRDAAGQLIPASLYDMRGDIYAGDTGTVNPQDMTPHYDSQFKLPGFQEVEKNIGISGPDETAKFAPYLPQHTGTWHGSGDEWYYAGPKQQLNPNTFYPSNFGAPSNYEHRPPANPLQGGVINGLLL